MTHASVIENSCSFCGVLFYSENVKKYCSRSCEGKSYRRRKGLKAVKESIIKRDCKCIVCGNLFDSYNKHPTFCSIKCKGDYQSATTDIKTAIELYESGLSQDEIAVKLNVSQRSIHHLFKRNKYKCRVAAKRNQWAEKNDAWKGDGAGYAAFHDRVYRARGKAFRCEECGRSDDGIKYDWANQTGHYEDIDDYKMMCRSCHRNYDNMRRRLTKNTIINAKH